MSAFGGKADMTIATAFGGGQMADALLSTQAADGKSAMRISG